MKIREILVLLNSAAASHPLKIKFLYEVLKGTGKDEFSVDQLREFVVKAGFPPRIKEVIFSPESLDTLNGEMETASREGIDIITLDDQGYPEPLRNIYDPPPVLYIKGRLDKGFLLGIVGSRKASLYGLNQARKIAYDLGSLGASIVSGLARGIDTYAHRGALEAGANTYAVLGSGLLRIYPSENSKIAEKITSQGAVISEFSLHTRPYAYNFPRRNRIISGLSRAIIVVEAAEKSGALITADFALEQGKDVLALPGNIDSPTSLGCLKLIKQGAQPFVSLDDIIEAFPELDRQGAGQNENAQGSISPQEEDILALLENPRLFDEIMEALDTEAEKLYKVLLALKVRRLVEELPGKRYVRT